MKTCGIIVEYNPMHKGHLYHIEQARKTSGCDVLIAVLSGCFSQRALPSLIDPYTKSMLAIRYGVDLVVELPAVYAAQSADRFARYAIETLANLKVDCIVFGSETNDIAALEQLLESAKSVQADPSRSWQANIGSAIGPNDILGMQYIDYAHQYGIVPLCIQRSPSFKSATRTRSDYFAGEGEEFLSDHFIEQQNWNSYYPYLRTFLLMSSPDTLAGYHLVNEGIEYRLIENASRYRTWDKFLEASVSKTYTRARIQRTCLFIMLQITKEEMKRNDSLHCSILLALNQTGRAYLNSIKKESIVYSKFSALPAFLQKVHLRTKRLYESVMPHDIKDTVYVE